MNNNLKEINKLIYEANQIVNKIDNDTNLIKNKEFDKVKNDLIKFKFSLSNLLYNIQNKDNED